MSALGADSHETSEYLRTKGEGESLVLSSGLPANVFCPSIIYGAENELIDLFVRNSKTRFFPRIPALMQPVYRDDISRLYTLAVEGKVVESRMEVGGPERMSIFQMARTVYNHLGRSCLPIPFFLVKSGMKMAAWFHILGIGEDQIGNLRRDNVTDERTAQRYIEMTRFTDWAEQNIRLA
jgi:NADH dehydrogenase